MKEQLSDLGVEKKKFSLVGLPMSDHALTLSKSHRPWNPGGATQIFTLVSPWPSILMPENHELVHSTKCCTSYRKVSFGLLVLLHHWHWISENCFSFFVSPSSVPNGLCSECWPWSLTDTSQMQQYQYCTGRWLDLMLFSGR